MMSPEQEEALRDALRVVQPAGVHLDAPEESDGASGR